MSSPDNGHSGDQPLGLWDAVSIITGIVIGTTIFKVPWLIFMNVSDPWTGMTVWLFGGLLALIGGLCYSELATTYPRSGGDYVYLTRAFGPWLGFLFGWAQLAVVLTASIGAMAFVFAENATLLYDLEQLGETGLSSEFMYAIGAIGVISFLNILGVQAGKWTQNLLTFAKIIGLGAIIIAGFCWVESSPMDWKYAEATNNPNWPWGALAVILVLYAYGGWNDAAFVAAEVRNSKRNIPLALILGIGLITLIYLLVNAAYLMGLGFDAARAPGAQLPQQLLEKMLPDFGGKAITIIIMISALGAVNGLIFTGARVYATLGNDYPLFSWLGHWRPGRSAPILALIVQALITVGIIYALCSREGHDAINQLLTHQYLKDFGIAIPMRTWEPGSAFQTLVDHTAPVFWFFFLMSGFALFRLRTNDAGIPRPFSVPFYPVLPIVFCNICAYMLYQSTTYVGFRALFAVLVVLLGIPLYLLGRLIGGYRGTSSSM